MRRRMFTSANAVTLLLTGGIAVPAFAQQTPATDARASAARDQQSPPGPQSTSPAPNMPAAADAATPPATGVQDIIVTAQRREQSLQRVPIAVSAFSGNTLEALRVENSTELLKFVPNVVSFNNGGQAAQANYYFRGIGTPEGLQTFDPPVLTYIDEVPLGRIGSANIQFLDLDRVEVLRGPQGTLFGRNVTGGAVAYYTRRPADDFRFSAVARYGERNHAEGQATVDVPLTSILFSQVSGFFQREDGYISSAYSGAHGYGAFKNYGGRVALRLQPSDRFSWNLSVDYARQEGLSNGIPGNPNSPLSVRNDERGTLFGTFRLNNLILVPCMNGSDPVDWARNNCTASVAENEGITSNIRLALSDSTQVNFITGVRRAKQRYSLDFSGNNPNNALAEFILANDSRYDQFSQEIKLTGSLLANRLKYVGGVFYYDEDDHTTIYDFLRSRGGQRTPNTFRYLRNTTESIAGYLQTDFEIVPRLTLTTGIRYTHDDKTIQVNLQNANTGAIILNTSTISGAPEITSGRWTPHASLQFQATPDIMFYGSYTKGFKSGGWNGRATSAAAFNSFGDEKVDSFEVGTRTTLFDRRLRFNLTAFLAKYKDLQINTAITSNGSTIFITDNAGDSQDKGIELETVFVITRELSGNLNLGLQKGRFTRLDRGTLAAGLTLNSPLPQTPPQTWSAGLTYSKKVAPLGGSITLTAAGQYIKAYNPGVTATSIQTDDLFFTNGTLGYAPDGGRFDIAVECRNCLRKVQNIYPLLPGTALLGELPYVGVRLGVKM